jgi:hypothetical protein
MSMFKLKPTPQDANYEEVEARSIIRPFSHHKYIQVGRFPNREY